MSYRVVIAGVAWMPAGSAVTTLMRRRSRGTAPALRRKAHDEATTVAVKRLMARIKSAALTLGLQVDYVQQVAPDERAYQPRPPFPVMAMAAGAMSSPQATSAPEEVTVGVSADYAC